MPVLILVLMLVLAAGAGQAAPPPPDPLKDARNALASGDLSTAERLLADTQGAGLNDLDFLKGTLAAAKGDHAAATRHFKAILARDPTLNRVRLDLARVCFMAGDDAAATHYFRAALAQGLPPEVRLNVERFLDEIRRRRRWSLDMALALAPDTNINAATGARSAALFGLPFELDEEARRTSGVGLTGNVAGSYTWDLGGAALKTGGSYTAVEYADGAFSDRTVNIFAGPSWRVGHRTTVSLSATGGARWYGGRPLNTSAGLRLDGDTALSPRWLVAGSLEARRTVYAKTYSDYTGPAVSFNSQVTYAPDAVSFLRAAAGVTRERARHAPFRNWQYSLGGGYYRERLPLGIALSLFVQANVLGYDQALAAFGMTRHDTEITTRLTLATARIDWRGFTPTLSLIHTDRRSNIALYAYRRNRVEIGVRRNF